VHGNPGRFHDRAAVPRPEAGGNPSLSSVLVTERCLSLDAGSEAADFILFDRRDGDVVNVLGDRKPLVRVTRQGLPQARPRVMSSRKGARRAHGLSSEERGESGRVRIHSGGGSKAYSARLFRLPQNCNVLRLPVD
jgi:hypothetical protein